MLELGWDVNTRGVVWNETPAHRAAVEGHLDTLKLLADRDADLTVLDRQYRCTPLSWARHGEKLPIIEHLRTLTDRLDAWDAIDAGTRWTQTIVLICSGASTVGAHVADLKWKSARRAS